MSFADLGLKPELLRAVDEKGYSVPTPIQAKAIPAVLAGGDVLPAPRREPGRPRHSSCPSCRNSVNPAGALRVPSF